MTQIVLAPTPEDAGLEKSQRRPLDWTWHQIKNNPGAATGGIVFLGILLLSLPARLVAPYDPRASFATHYVAPSPSHWLGLDDGGHDMVSLLIYGTRTSLYVGFAASFIAIIIGVGLGLLAGYYGRGPDATISSVTDFFLVIPEVPLMMVLSATLPGGQSLNKMILIIGGLLWTWTVRVIRSQVMSVKERVYVRRAKALGATDWRIVTRHVLPQVAPLIIVNFVLTVAVAVFDESALSFLGLGDPLAISLGRILDNANQGSAATLGAWWALVPAGAVIAILILSLTLMGQAVEDALNPRLKVSHLSRKHFLLLPNRSTDSGRPDPTPRASSRDDSLGNVA
ncbi:MAG: ABC transporter permease [Actinomycetes bacterium]